MMMDVVRARIDRRVKKTATAALRKIGLTPSDAFRMMMVRIAHEKRLPFEPLVLGPKAEEARKEIESGKATRFQSVDELMADLND